MTMTKTALVPHANRTAPGQPRASVAVPFPDALPPGYSWLEGEPRFDPKRHLALEAPTSITTLFDLGYTEAEVTGKASTLAASSPFRILSDEGASIMLDVAHRLETFVQPAADRIERSVRGAVYRSRWLRDLCISPEVANHMAAIYGCDIAPHAMPLHLGHLNYSPSRINVGIDKWHHDTLALDYVLMVTDPASVAGGRFEYFVGTKAEAAELAAVGQTPPRDRVVAPDIPGPGYAVALHGNMVVHRAAPLERLDERITMVNGYVATDPTVDDQSRTADLAAVDDPAVLYAEWARYTAWRTKIRLEHLMDTTQFGLSPDQAAQSLHEAAADLEQAIIEMQNPKRSADHYEVSAGDGPASP